jgi:hypothetical protein
MSMKWVRCLNHILQHTPSETPSESPTTATLTVRLVRPSIYQVRVTSLWLLAAVDSEGAETLYIYIWTRPVMSMKWMGCLNHNSSSIPVRLQVNHLPLVPLWPSIHQAGVASLWPPAMVDGDEIHCICMKWICYEHEVDKMPQSLYTTCHLTP